MFNINKYLRCNCEFHKRNKCVYLQLNEQNCLFVVSGSISFGRHSIFKTDNYISTFCSTHLLHSVVNCPKFWCPSPLAWWLVTSVPRARTQISNVTIIHVGYSQGEPGPGWEEGGGGFLLLSTFLLVALMSYQILLLCGASPGQPSSQTRSILSLKNDQFPLVASPENKIIFRAYLRALK